MEKFIKSVRIPSDRLAVLIGKSGSVISELERRTNTRINIDKSGLVTISGDIDKMSNVYKAVDVIKAIGRGFAPHRAFKLLEEGYELRVISLRLYANTKNRKRIIRGRLIGRNGMARLTIERMTNTFISVYKDTVSIIGKVPGIDMAEDAIMKIILGRKHTNVFRGLQETIDRLKEMTEEELLSPGNYKLADVNDSVDKAIADFEEESGDF